MRRSRGVRERQDHVVVRLRDRGAVPAEAPAALGVRREDRPVDLGLLLLEPGEQRRAEVEAHRRVVVDDRDDAVLLVEDARVRVGRVALGRDALVPVVVRVGGGLTLDRLEPRVLAGRLVEVPVDADVAASRPAEATGREHRRVVTRPRAPTRSRRPASCRPRRPPPRSASSALAAGGGFRKTAPSGGSVSAMLCERPCAGTASATARPRLPTPEPPYSAASLLAISVQSPGVSTPTRYP